VRHEQRARARRLEDGGDLLAQRGAQAGVERGEGLVEQDDLRLGGERPGQGDPLALAPGQLVGVRPRPFGQADQLEARLDLASAGLAEADVGRHRQVREEGAILEDHPHAPLVRFDPGAIAGDERAADAHRPGVGRVEPCDDAQQRGLPRPARAEQGDEVAVLDDEAGAVDRPRGTEGLHDARSTDGGGLLHAAAR
jgi:hypothetical protein